MKKAAFQISAGNRGFIQTTLAPVRDRKQPKFGWTEFFALAALVIGSLTLARLLLAH